MSPDLITGLSHPLGLHACYLLPRIRHIVRCCNFAGLLKGKNPLAFTLFTSYIVLHCANFIPSGLSVGLNSLAF